MQVLPLTLWIACNSGPESDPYGAIVSLTVEPPLVELSTGPDAPEEQQFVVIAEFETGHIEEDLDLVEWSLSNESVGEMRADGRFTTSTDAGGRTLVQAAAGGLSATAEVSVTYRDVVTTGDVPTGADTMAETGTPSDALSWAYPEDGAALPLNVPSMTFMWWDDEPADAYRLRLTSKNTLVEVYTAEQEVEIEESLWRVISATNAGSEVTVELDAVTLSGGEVTSQRTGPAQSFLVNRFDAQGTILYFSTSEAGVIASPVDEVAPEAFMGKWTDNSDDNCVGCHVVSADGERMAYAWQPDATIEPRMGVANTESGSPDALLPHENSTDHGQYSTFSPDGEFVVFSWDEELHFFDGRTGEYLSTLDTDLKLTMPDWARDDSRLVAVSGVAFGDHAFGRSEIVSFEHLGDGVFGEPQILVPQESDGNVYYPMISPDSKWIAYNHSSTGQTRFTEDASLRLISIEGGTPIVLENANRSADLTNSWPRWGPVPDDDILWLSFASSRDYGFYAAEDSQIWIAGIDTYVAETGVDPSYPAYRLPQQDLNSSNHASWWAVF